MFGLWAAITALSGLALLVGAALLGGAHPYAIALVQAAAAGALLTMAADTMIPEAVEGARTGRRPRRRGLLVAFFLSYRT